MDKDKLFKDNILLINENYKLNNQLNILNSTLKSCGLNKENLKEIIDKLKVNIEKNTYTKCILKIIYWRPTHIFNLLITSFLKN